jgi:hypothetical protein
MGDANGDGYDEILKGPLALDHTGKTLWDEKLIKGHGDYFHIGILNPARSGLQIFRILEAAQANGVAMLDAATGTVLWGKTIAGDASRGYSSHIDSRQKGAQCWAGQINDDLLNYDGSVLCNGTSPSKGDHWAPIWWEGGVHSFHNRRILGQRWSPHQPVEWRKLQPHRTDEDRFRNPHYADHRRHTGRLARGTRDWAAE